MAGGQPEIMRETIRESGVTTRRYDIRGPIISNESLSKMKLLMTYIIDMEKLLLVDSVLICLILQGTKGTANMKLYTENEVFEFLCFPLLAPHERNI
ncbi:hypothetical protein MTR_5g035540 [Medicago truncatula]|uniref:Uncharacterized protein n=1 Tax=Medicago truncatula TaxID=3880 RepID=G7K460_MEDTR|nr:hypothetical protein MTR_5g035540 [Medicago truncatula]